MKILLSAYACEPNRGSEPGVGWNWALALARRGHDVWVITRSNNQECIEAELSKNPVLGCLNFYYYDLPSWIRYLKKMPGGVYWYYLIWQAGILQIAQRLHSRKSFDLVHHITFGVFRQPSFLWKLRIPFIFGPVGGGEKAPPLLCRSLTWQQIVKEKARDVANYLSNFDPMTRSTFRYATLVLAKTPETRLALPKIAQLKCSINFEIGIDNFPERRTVYGGAKKFLFVGRFIYWKGGQYAIKGFARAARQNPDLTLTLVGKGPQKEEWIDLARKEGVQSQVDFIDWLPQAELKALYRMNDVFLFPSLHDSSGNVILEAMSNGLPVICLRLGGPGVLVDEDSGIVVPVTESSDEAYVVDDLSRAINKIVSDRSLFDRLCAGAYEKSGKLSWDNVVGRVYESIEDGGGM